MDTLTTLFAIGPLALAAIPAAIAAAGSIGGSILGNKANAKAAGEQMDFQERMSSTALQRSAKDAEAAGLNRILAFNNAASTPGGATYTSNYGDLGASAGINAVSTAQQIKNAKSQQEVILEQANNLAANTKSANEQAEKIKTEREQSKIMFPLLQNESLARSEQQRTSALANEASIEKLRQDARVSKAAADQAEFQKLIYADPRTRAAATNALNSLHSAKDAAGSIGGKIGAQGAEAFNSAKQWFREKQRERQNFKNPNR